MGASLTDSAVGDGLAVAGYAGSAVNRLEFLDRLERAVLRYRGGPGYISRARDVAAAL